MLDKEGPPPGVDESQRLVVLLGDQAQVRAARAEIDLLITNPNYRAGRRLERGRLANSLNPMTLTLTLALALSLALVLALTRRLADSLEEGAKLASSVRGALAPFSSSGSDALLEAPPPPAHQLVEHIISSRLAERLTTAHYAALLRMAKPATSPPTARDLGAPEPKPESLILSLSLSLTLTLTLTPTLTLTLTRRG